MNRHYLKYGEYAITVASMQQDIKREIYKRGNGSTLSEKWCNRIKRWYNVIDIGHSYSTGLASKYKIEFSGPSEYIF